MQPFSMTLSVRATHAVTTSVESSPQYVPSWCHEMKPGSRGYFGKMDTVHTRMSGPRTSSTASRILGCVASSYAQRKCTWVCPSACATGRPPRWAASSSKAARKRAVSAGESTGIGKRIPSRR